MRNESPESAIQRILAEDRMSRRRFMGRAGSAAFGATALGALISACGPAEGNKESSGGGASTTEAVSHPKTALKTVVFSNWPLYIDKAVIKDFKSEFNATLKYTEDINDNNEFFGKVRQPLEQGDSIGRDLVALTDWMAARWIRLGYVEPIDEKNVPNKANLRDVLVDLAWDKGRKQSLPWQSGMTGIGYNKKVVGEVTSLKQLLDPKWKGKVTMLSEARDTLGLILLSQGKKPEDATIDDILAASEELDKINRSGQIRKFTGNDYTTDLAKGNVVMSFAWSGDMVQLKADNPDLEFVVPEEGGMLWSDNMMIPQKAPSPYGAEVAMNWFYEPEVAAKIAAYVNYVTPVKGVQEILAADKDKEVAALADNALIFPTPEIDARTHSFPDLDVEQEQQMNEAFAGVTGA